MNLSKKGEEPWKRVRRRAPEKVSFVEERVNNSFTWSERQRSCLSKLVGSFMDLIENNRETKGPNVNRHNFLAFPMAPAEEKHYLFELRVPFSSTVDRRNQSGCRFWLPHFEEGGMPLWLQGPSSNFNESNQATSVFGFISDIDGESSNSFPRL